MHKSTSFSFIFLTLLMISLSWSQNTVKVDSILNEIHRENSHDTTKIKGFNDLGIQYAASDPKRAKSYIRQAIQLAEKIDKPRGMAGAYNCLGIVYYYQREYDSAKASFGKALAINRKLNHLWGQGSALNQIGVIQVKQDQYYEAIQSYKEAQDIFAKMNDSVAMVSSFSNIGMVYNSMGDYQKSYKYYFEALQLSEKLNDIEGKRIGYIRISNVYHKQKEYRKALNYLEKALPMAKKAGNKVHIASILEKMAKCHKELKLYDKALFLYKNALQQRISISNKKGSALTRVGIGETYYAMSNYAKAKEEFQEALPEFKLQNNQRLASSTQLQIAKCNMKLNQFKNAEEYFMAALNTSIRINNIGLEKEIYQYLAPLQEELNQPLRALSTYKKYITLNDSIFTLEKENKISTLQTIYETEKKEQEIALQKNEIQLLEQNARVNNLQRILLATILGICLLVFGLGFYGLRQKIKRNRLEKEKVDAELAHKHKELTTHALHLAKKNEVLESLKQQAEELQEIDNSANGYQQLISTINFDLKDENNWKNFTKYFEQVHKNFNRNIKEKYPALTPNELRLMALLKMSLSSKEIASILNISQDGVKKARYRLRKKLKISTTDSLEDVIIQI